MLKPSQASLQIIGVASPDYSDNSSASRRAIEPVGAVAIGSPIQERAAYPTDTSAVLLKLMRDYDLQKKPVAVSFRKLVPWLKVGERAAHYIHPYPAKLLPQIAHFFLAAGTFVRKDAKVLDPFAGSGTVTLETMLSGRHALFAEVNPVARLIVRCKTNPPSADNLKKSLSRVQRRFQKGKKPTLPDVINSSYWYGRATFRTLAEIISAIQCEKEEGAREALAVAFSITARKASRADPRFSVPVRVKTSAALTVQRKKARLTSVRDRIWNLFAAQVEASARRFKRQDAIMPIPRPMVSDVGSDARCLETKETSGDGVQRLRNSSIDLIITSPPYASAQKYVRATSLSLGWLGYTSSRGLSELEQKTIGREHILKRSASGDLYAGLSDEAQSFVSRVSKINMRRAAITSIYLREMSEAVGEMARVLKPGCPAVIVIGDNQICGARFDSAFFIKQMFQSAGFDIVLHLKDAIPSRALMTRRHQTAGVITEENILVFQKRIAA